MVLIGRALELLRAAAPSLIGLACLGLVVAGVWGLGGWEWGLITAGAPGAAFYVYGEARRARGSSEG